MQQRVNGIARFLPLCGCGVDAQRRQRYDDLRRTLGVIGAVAGKAAGALLHGFQRGKPLVHSGLDICIAVEIVGSQRLEDHSGHIHVGGRSFIAAVDPAAALAGVVQQERNIFVTQRVVARIFIRLGIQRQQRVGHRIDALSRNTVIIAHHIQNALRCFHAQRGHGQRDAGIVCGLGHLGIPHIPQDTVSIFKIGHGCAAGIRAADDAAAGQRQNEPLAIGAADGCVIVLVQQGQCAGQRVLVLDICALRQLGKGRFRVGERRIVIDLCLVGVTERIIGRAGRVDGFAAVGRHRADAVDELNDQLCLADLPELAATFEVDVRERRFQRLGAGFKGHTLFLHGRFQRCIAADVLIVEPENRLIPALGHIRVAPGHDVAVIGIVVADAPFGELAVVVPEAIGHTGAVGTVADIHPSGIVLSPGGDTVHEHAELGGGAVICPVAGVFRLQGGAHGVAGRGAGLVDIVAVVGDGGQGRLVVCAVNGVFVEAPGHSVAALAAGSGVQRGLGFHQRGGGIVREGDLQCLLLIHLAHFIAEGAVLAVPLIGDGLLFRLGIRLLAHFVQTVGVRIVLKEVFGLFDVAGHFNVRRQRGRPSVGDHLGGDLLQVRASGNGRMANICLPSSVYNIFVGPLAAQPLLVGIRKSIRFFDRVGIVHGEEQGVFIRFRAVIDLERFKLVFLFRFRVSILAGCVNIKVKETVDLQGVAEFGA